MPAAWSITACTRPDGHDDLQAVLRTTVAESTVWRPVQGRQRQHRLSGPGPCPPRKLFYQRSLSLLQYSGVLVFIVPGYVLDAELVGWLTRHYTDLRIYRAVETQFKQVVIFGRRVPSAGAGTRWRQGRAQSAAAGWAWRSRSRGTAERMAVPAVHRPRQSGRAGAFLPRDDGARTVRRRGWPAARPLAVAGHALGAAQQSLRPPARALSHWHLALALAAGAISGVVRSQTGRVLVVKGDTHKDKTLQREFTEREDGSIAETRILTDKFVPVIRAWDMTPGSPTRGEVLTIR